MGILSSMVLVAGMANAAFTDRLEILEAWYGIHGNSCEFSNEAASECNGEDYCEIYASNRLCGDPARNTRKVMFVSYTCGDGTRTLEVREGESARIYCLGAKARPGRDNGLGHRCRNRFDCDNGFRQQGIVIEEVSYGVGNRYCDATYTFEEACDGRFECSVEIDNDLCGDPARGKRKEATIDYQCRGKSYRVSVRENDYATLSCERY